MPQEGNVKKKVKRKIEKIKKRKKIVYINMTQEITLICGVYFGVIRAFDSLGFIKPKERVFSGTFLRSTGI